MGKDRRNKRAAWAHQPSTNKNPKGLETGEAASNTTKFCWRCNWIDLDGEWGFRDVPCERLWNEIIPRLHEFDSMTWGEITGGRNTSNHPMPVENIEPGAADRLRQIGKQDYDTLVQLNVRGGFRLWGIRDRAYFYLLWFDPDHTVYVQKKDR